MPKIHHQAKASFACHVFKPSLPSYSFNVGIPFISGALGIST